MSMCLWYVCLWYVFVVYSVILNARQNDNMKTLPFIDRS